jgi:hypothetical protein
MRSGARAALLVLLAGCGPRVAPGAVGDEPTASPTRPTAPRAGPASARAVVIGEMCPAAAGGRPGVAPWFVRQLGWLDQPEEVAAPIARGAARQFAVLAFDGRRAGLFSAIGLAESDGERLAAGGYAGTSPCTRPSTIDGARELDPACVRVQRECGIALAEVVTAGQAPVGEDPEPIVLDVGGACVVGGALVVDLDGDGVAERYPVAGFLDEASAPAEEVVALPGEAPACQPRFSLPELVPGRHPRGFEGMDLLGVIDADGDGRRELLFQLRYAGRRTAALYAAPDTAARLELVGEAIAR